jgi:hypothetical protein
LAVIGGVVLVLAAALTVSAICRNRCRARWWSSVPRRRSAMGSSDADWDAIQLDLATR